MRTRGGVGAVAEFQVAGRRQAAEHVLEVAGDGDFRNRKGDLAILDPEAGGAAAVIAGDAIDAHAHQFGDIEALFDVGDQLLRRKLARFQIEIGGGRRGRPARAARGMAGGRQARAAGRWRSPAARW